eukprot:superscaffoldBa00004006_g18101
MPCSEPAPSQAVDPWSKVGAQLKAPVSSTPQKMEPWKTICRSKHGRKSPGATLPSGDIQLTDRFNALDKQEFPPLKGCPWSPLPVDTAGRSAGLMPQRKPAFPPAVTPALRRNLRVLVNPLHPVLLHSPPYPPLQSFGRTASSSSAPSSSHFTAVVIGDSIVRNIRMKTAKMYCFPGVRVQDINSRIQEIRQDHPKFDRIVVRVGVNDITKQQLELLKLDFIHLLK